MSPSTTRPQGNQGAIPPLAKEARQLSSVARGPAPGRSAYDTISRAAFLPKLREVAPALLPFARAFYGRTSEYLWWDSAGSRHSISQGEGCDQGDALAPALYSLGQHDGLVAAQAQLHPNEFLAAFLDDLYVVTTADRARLAGDAVSGSVERYAGVSPNQGNTRVYCAAGRHR